MATNTSTSVHVKIRNIGPGNDNLLLKGVIIRKQDPRVVRIRRDNSERCVWSFTLRDSPSDLINVNIWGSVEYVQNLSTRFHVGDVVDVLNVKAVFRKVSDSDDLYQPAVTSSFSISFNENQSDMRLSTSNVDELLSLLAIPTKPPGNFLTISDIHTNGQKLRGQFVNLLAAVREVAAKRQFKSKDGRDLECRDVTLIDESYATLTMTIWGSGLLSMSDKWSPRSTVLFLADVRVDWNEYRQAITTSTTARTIVTENPRTTKAANLKHFMASTPFQASGKLDQIINKYIDPSVITTVMSCIGVLAKSREERQNTEFTAVVYALLERFDIDDGSDYFLLTKCMRCNWRVDPSIEICLNANCPSGTGTEPSQIDQVYDIRVGLLDHTGSLTNCRLTNAVAVKMLGCKATSFQTLHSDEKTKIKWRYLLKYCAVRMVVMPMREKEMPIISILSLDLLSPSEYSNLVPMM